MSLYTLAPQPWLVFLDDAGLYIPNGQLAIYVAGTSTPAVVYVESTGLPHPWPITLDSAGRVPGGLYLQPGMNYKFVLHAPQIEEPLDGPILKSQDNVAAVPLSGGSLLNLISPGDHASIGVSGVNVIEYTGSGDVNLRGLTGGVPGQSILIRNLTAYTMWLYPSDPAAPACSGLVNFVAKGPTPLAGPKSSARYTYVSSGSWVMETHAQGDPLGQAFDPLNYVTIDAGVTWGVEAADIETELFYINGRKLLYTFRIHTTSISGGTTTGLARKMPYGWEAHALFVDLSAIIVTNDMLNYPGGIAVAVPLHVIFQQTPFTTPWTVVVNAAGVFGQIEMILN